MEDYAIITPMPTAAKRELKSYGYDKCLKIVLHGDPITASHRASRGHVINVNLAKLKARFKPLYHSSELLQNTMIHSVYHIDYKYYLKTTIKDMAFIKKDHALLFKYNKDKLEDLSIKDIDNMQKVHGDLIFTRDFRLTIDDAYNVGYHRPEKFTSKRPRVEILIYFRSKMTKWHKYKILGSALHMEHLVCHKAMMMAKRDYKKQMSYLRKYINKELDKTKKVPDQVKIIKRLANVLEEYPVDTLKSMGNLSKQHRKFNKYDAVLKIIMLLLSKHRDLVDVMTGLKRK